MKTRHILVLLLAVGLPTGIAAIWSPKDIGEIPSHSISAQSTTDWISGVASAPVEGLGRPVGAWELDLSRDHGPHSDARTEAWQFMAHLRNASGHPVGVQLSLFRIGLVPPDAPPPASPWEPREVFRGHVIVVEGAQPAVFGEERFGRGMDGLAGYDATLQEIRLDNWSVAFASGAGTGEWLLRSSAGDARVELQLIPDHAPVVADTDGGPFRGYAFNRLRAEGILESAGARQSIAGFAWLEHFWGELPVPGAGPVASDRLQLQLDDGSTLSVVRSRRVDGRGTPTVDAFLIGPEGEAASLNDETLAIDLPRFWRGRAADWPVDWTLRFGDLVLSVTPVTDDQEQAFVVPVWSGLVEARGQRAGQPVTGIGTLQLTGYAQP